MTESDFSVDTFIKEIQASLSDSDSAAILHRINAERLLHLAVEELARSMQGTRIRLLTGHGVMDAAGSDFLLQVDDYDLRLQLLTTDRELPTLQPEQLAAFQEILEANPNTVALILVWTVDNLPAVALSVARIRYLRKHPERLSDLLRMAKPAEEMLHEVVERQVKEWDIPAELLEQEGQKPADLRDSFATSLDEALEIEMQRSYRLPARKAAAENFPLREERKRLLQVFDSALTGASVEDLIAQLMDLSRRGGA